MEPARERPDQQGFGKANGGVFIQWKGQERGFQVRVRPGVKANENSQECSLRHAHIVSVSKRKGTPERAGGEIMAARDRPPLSDAVEIKCLDQVTKAKSKFGNTVSK